SGPGLHDLLRPCANQPHVAGQRPAHDTHNDHPDQDFHITSPSASGDPADAAPGNPAVTEPLICLRILIQGHWRRTEEKAGWSGGPSPFPLTPAAREITLGPFPSSDQERDHD